MLLLQTVVHVELLDVVLSEGDVVVVPKGCSRSCAERVVFLRLPHEAWLAFYQGWILLTYHRVSFLLVLSWTWKIWVLVWFESFFLGKNTIRQFLERISRTFIRDIASRTGRRHFRWKNSLLRLIGQRIGYVMYCRLKSLTTFKAILLEAETITARSKSFRRMIINNFWSFQLR